MGDSRLEVHRRKFLGVVIGGGAAAAAPLSPAMADTGSDADKRKALYQADAPEVQTFYRVNRYPPK
jgi:hypothetical protein